MLAALAVSALILSLAPPNAIGPWWMLALLAALSLAWVLWQPATTTRDDALPALAVVLSALGSGDGRAPLAGARTEAADLADRRTAPGALLGPAFTAFRRVAGYKYVWVIASLILFAMLVVFGQEVNGAKLWIALGPVQLEPVELIKLFIVFFLAAYLAETADVIAAGASWKSARI